MALPASVIGEEYAELEHVSRAEVDLGVLLVGVGEVVVPEPVAAGDS